VRPSPTAGQASLEYVAVISLVTVLLLAAAPAVGAPSLAGSVARGIRIGLCVVVDDICTREEAAAAGLPPCQLDSQTKGYDGRVTVFSVELGSRNTLTGYTESDGSVDLTWTGGVSAGLAYGIGAEIPGLSVEAGGAARAKLNVARGWRFPDEATARRFIAGMPKSAADQARWPATWHTVEGGAEVEADAGESARGVDLAALGVSAADVLGARIGPGDVRTLYFNASIEGVEATLPAVPSTGHGRGSLIGELTLDGATPRAVALRHIEPSNQNSRLTETVYRLKLGGRRPPPPWQIPGMAGRAGTIERNVYSYSDRTRGVSGEVALGLKFGVDAKLVEIRRTLVDATARTPDSDKQRSRFDCLDQLR
jgi:hypothetical protein